LRDSSRYRKEIKRKNKDNLQIMLRRVYERFVKIQGHPREIALGFSLGLFVGVSPIIGRKFLKNDIDKPAITPKSWHFFLLPIAIPSQLLPEILNLGRQFLLTCDHPPFHVVHLFLQMPDPATHT
jgi:hypothetical protein